jgi:hypothetical protein
VAHLSGEGYTDEGTPERRGEKTSARPASTAAEPVEMMNGEGSGTRAGSQTGLLGKKNKNPSGLAREGEPELDQARFTAGIVRFYEALLNEPIPEKMLRLIEEIAMRERKS